MANGTKAYGNGGQRSITVQRWQVAPRCFVAMVAATAKIFVFFLTRQLQEKKRE